MTNWKGNTVQIGDTVIIRQVKEMFDGTTARMRVINFQEGTSKVVAEHFIPRKYLWNMVMKIKVVPGNYLQWSTQGPSEDVIGIEAIGWIEPQPCQILCIEGKSDDETEYYLHEFNQ